MWDQFGIPVPVDSDCQFQILHQNRNCIHLLCPQLASTVKCLSGLFLCTTLKVRDSQPASQTVPHSRNEAHETVKERLSFMKASMNYI